MRGVDRTTSGLSFPGNAVVNAGKYNSFPWDSMEKTYSIRHAFAFLLEG